MRTRTIILSAFLLILSCAIYAYARGPCTITGSGGIEFPGQGMSAGSTYQLYWDGECTGNDRRDAMLSAGVCGGITGTLSGATIVNTDESSYYLSADAVNEYLQFTSASVTGYDPDEFYVSMLVKVTGSTAELQAIMECITDSNNRWFATVTPSTRQVAINHTGNGTISYNLGNDNSVESLQTGYWGVVQIKYSTTNSVIHIRVCSTAGSDCLTCDGGEAIDITTDTSHVGYADMTATPTNVVVGESAYGGGHTGETRIDKVEIGSYANAPF